MRSKVGLVVVGVILVACGIVWAAEPPVAVSPGSATGTVVEGRCPTFIWGAMAGAQSYELVVYRAEDGSEEEKPVWRQELPGSAPGWTPSLDRCLGRGNQYAWSVRAIDRKEASEWSSPSLFEVASGPSDAEFEEALAVVRSYVARHGEATGDVGNEAGPLVPSSNGVVERAAGPKQATVFNPVVQMPAGDVAIKASGGQYGVEGFGDNSAGVGVAGYGNRGVVGIGQSIDGYGALFTNPLQGSALLVEGGGQAKEKAALRVVNNASPQGMAAYLTNASAFATAHFANADTGQVLWLENGGTDGSGTGGGDFITAVNKTGAPLDVQFRVTTSGEVFSDIGFNTPAADFAEMLPAIAGVEPGDVLVIGVSGRLERSSEPHQTNVAGVYSTQPGFTGGMPVSGPIDGTVPLAVVGIVPVKATDEGGAIRPGDLLVTSPTAGHAMRADRVMRDGTVIGKALEALDAGHNTIRMLVVLQ